MIRPLLLLPSALSVLALGCPPTTSDDDDSTPVSGRVTVAGGGVFDNIQDGIDAAPDCGTVQVAAGVYDEALTIEKCITIVGEARDAVQVLGGGRGTMVRVDQVSGPVLVSGMSFIGPFDQPATNRGFRLTNATDVTLSDVLIAFEPGQNDEPDHGTVGIDVSQSVALLSEVEIVRVGFLSEVGGTSVFAQSSSTLEVEDSSIEGSGSFGIHSVGGLLTVRNTSVMATNRPTTAEDFEEDGTGIYMESGSEEVVLENVTLDNGSFVAAWMDTPRVTVTGGTFSRFAYGVYLPGDAASASGRQLTVAGTTFSDIRQESILSVASTNVAASTFTNAQLVDPAGGSNYIGIRAVAPGGDISVTGSTFTGHGVRAIGAFGNTADGRAATVTITGNTVSNVVAGNGIQVLDTEVAVIENNIVQGVDHAWYTDPDNPGDDGLIVNGFGLSCFRVTSCAMEQNEVRGAEFANLVVVDSLFSSTSDVFGEATWRGAQIESSQGAFAATTWENSLGVAATFIDSTIQAEGCSVTGQLRGPYFRDVDGNEDDPLPEERLDWYGGEAIEAFSQGSVSYLEWTGGTFTDNVDSAVVTQDTQLVLEGNVFVNNGYEYDDGSGVIFGSGPVVSVYGGDPLAVTGPSIQDNTIDGGNGSYGMYVSSAPDVEVANNTVCAGQTAGMYLGASDGALIRNNDFGATADATVTHCAEFVWSYGLFVSGGGADGSGAGVELRNNLIDTDGIYGVYLSVSGDVLFAGNTIDGPTAAAMQAAFSTPSSFTDDSDGDGAREYEGDCDDTDPFTWRLTGAAATETPGDGIDQDCDGIADDGLSTADNDGDTYTIADGDCDDTDAARNPGVVEIVSNQVDDNCDGWADFDGDLPTASVTLEGNTITNVGSVMGVTGTAVTLSGTVPNTIGPVVGDAFQLSTWTFGGTPAQQPASLVIGDGNTLTGVGGTCVVVQGIAASASIGAASLECGGDGVRLAAAGSVGLVGTTITNSGGEAVEINAGTGSLDGATVTGSGGDAVRVTGGSVAIAGGAIANAGLNGVNLLSGAATLTGTDIGGSALAGVRASGGTLTVGDALIHDNGGDGIELLGNVAATVDGPTLDANGGYGLSCDGEPSDPLTSTVDLPMCSATAMDNVGGAFDLTGGCEVEWACTGT